MLPLLLLSEEPVCAKDSCKNSRIYCKHPASVMQRVFSCLTKMVLSEVGLSENGLQK